MCGIAGYLGGQICEETITLMTDDLYHRGPDSYGVWVDSDNGIALGHRRLSILDLSDAGHQPMHSKNNRYVLTYNGEIYNFLSIKNKLSKLFQIDWKGHSDTEVLTELISYFGIEKSLEMINGMFAFALWDKEEKCLYLACDRFGEKPLYYGECHGVFLFASELSAIKKHPSFCPDIDRESLGALLQYNYIPSPKSIYSGISKLSSGNYLEVDFSSKTPVVSSPSQYWKLNTSREIQLEMSFEDATDRLDGLLSDSVESRMISDVPLGALLSGGIDSSMIVSLMQKKSSVPIKTFTIGFKDKAYNEATDAKRVANYLKTDHCELYLSPSDILNSVPYMSKVYSEPFADQSQIPTYLVSSLAHENVKVCLSGDAGDELFAGYNRHYMAPMLWNRVKKAPPYFRRQLSKFINSIPPSKWDKLYYNYLKFLPINNKHRLFGDKLYKLSNVLSCENIDEVYESLISKWSEPGEIVIGCSKSRVMNESYGELDFMHSMLYMDLYGYLPGDILTKIDRASMAVSLECRVPFLDVDVVNFAWSLPSSYKASNGEGKLILKNLLSRYIPREIIDRPKMGFACPVDSWLKSELFEWASDLLSKDRIIADGYFNYEAVNKAWNEHLSGKRDNQNKLWSVLMFQSWLNDNRL